MENTFYDDYEEWVNKVQHSYVLEEFDFPSARKAESFTARLKEKREEGIKKYGDQSFQLSEENAFATPIYQHMEEELLDLINYLTHLIYIKSIDGDIYTSNLGNDIKLLSKAVRDTAQALFQLEERLR